MSKRSHASKRGPWIALALGCLFAFVVAEVGIRLGLRFVAKNPVWYLPIGEMRQRVAEGGMVVQPHPYLAYVTSPGFSKGKLRHDERGYRHEAIVSPKPEGLFRIVALGGSTTYSTSIEANEESFTYQLQRQLREDYGHDDVEVICAGVAGYTSWETLINFQLRVLDLEPDLVMIYHAYNDIAPRLVEPEAYRSDNALRSSWNWPDAGILEASALYRYLSRTFFEGGIEVLNLMSFVEADESDYDREQGLERLDENEPIYFARNLENLVASAKFHGVPLLFASFAHREDFVGPTMDLEAGGPSAVGIAQHNGIVEQIAAEQDLFFFDFARAMPQDASLWSDGIHVNEQGAAAKARLYAEYLDEQVFPALVSD